jgi:DNA-binding NtrC family response regulator
MTKILLVGQDEALLEGLVQSLVALGHSPAVALSLADARELAVRDQPLLAVVDRRFASASAAEVLGLPLAAGGALVLYRTTGDMALALPPVLQRAVLADLTLPLERNRLVALAQSVEERARAAGRMQRERNDPPEATHAP